MIVHKTTNYRKETSADQVAQADLFAHTYQRPCVVCRTPFEAPVRRAKGRPQKFCGDACRLIQMNKQKRASEARARAAAKAGPALTDPATLIPPLKT